MLHGLLLAEDVVGHVFRVQAHGNVDAITDIAEDDGHMLHRVPGQGIGLRLCGAERRFERKLAFLFDQRFLALTIGDEISHRHLLHAMGLRKGRNLRAAHDGAVIIHQFADNADERQACQLAEIDCRFRMAGAHQHAAFAGYQRKDMAGSGEIRSACVWVGEVANRHIAVAGGNACGRAVFEVYGNGKGGGVGAIVFRDHGVEIEAFCLFPWHGRADDAGGVAHDKGHFFRRAVHRGNDQIAFVFAVVIIHDNNDLTGLEGPDSFNDTLLIICHGGLCSYFRRPVWPRSLR